MARFSPSLIQGANPDGDSMANGRLTSARMVTDHISAAIHISGWRID
jgi:hypothetical protein